MANFSFLGADTCVVPPLVIPLSLSHTHSLYVSLSLSLSLLQVAYHVGMGADPGGLFSFSKAHGIVVEAYSPLGDNTTELISGPLTSGIGAAHGKSSVQVALRYIVQHGHALTTKSSNPKVGHRTQGTGHRTQDTIRAKE